MLHQEVKGMLYFKTSPAGKQSSLGKQSIKRAQNREFIQPIRPKPFPIPSLFLVRERKDSHAVSWVGS